MFEHNLLNLFYQKVYGLYLKDSYLLKLKRIFHQEGYEFNVLLGLKKNLKKTNYILFEHHFDDMIKKGYKFKDINNLLIKNNVKKIYKAKMPFRKSFEYI